MDSTAFGSGFISLMHTRRFCVSLLVILSAFRFILAGHDLDYRDILTQAERISSENATLQRKAVLYSELLAQYSDIFDPQYDQDIELETRRRYEFMRRGGVENPKAFVSFSEIQQWEPTNVLQVALWGLVEKLAQVGASQGVTRQQFNKSVLKGLPEKVQEAVMRDMAFCQITNRWASSAQGAINSVRTWIDVRKEVSNTNSFPIPSRVRYIRKILDFPIIWEETIPEQVAGAIGIMENLRAEIVQELSKDTRVFANQISCFRMAEAVAVNKHFVERANGLVARMQKEGAVSFVGAARTFDNDSNSVFADKFMRAVTALWGNLKENSYLSIIGDGQAARRAFIREITTLAHASMDEAREMDSRFEYMDYEALGKKDELVARRVAEWERTHPRPKREKPRTTFEFGSYPATPELRKELAKYGMTAGFFTAKAAESTNRLAYMLFTPKGGKLSAKAPLLAYIPGSGEIGEDLTRQFRCRAIFKLVTSEEFQQKHPCYMLAISPPDGTTAIFGRMPDGGPNDLEAAIGELIRGVARTRKSPQVDEARIYGTGFSFGGTAVYGLAFAMPDLFAASIPIATTIFDPVMVPASPPLNFYHLYNEGDYRKNGIDPVRLNAFGDRVRECGGDFRVGTFPVEGHNAWDAAWSEEGVWDWLFSKRKGAAGAVASRRGQPSPARTVSATCTASRPGRDDRSSPARAVDGLDGTAYVSEAPMGKGDWFQIEFAEPVSGRFSIKTGLADGTGRLAKGQVESSSDGRFWTSCARFRQSTGECSFEARTRISHLRILPEESPPRILAIREVAFSK